MTLLSLFLLALQGGVTRLRKGFGYLGGSLGRALWVFMAIVLLWWSVKHHTWLHEKYFSVGRA